MDTVRIQVCYGFEKNWHLTMGIRVKIYYKLYKVNFVLPFSIIRIVKNSSDLTSIVKYTGQEMYLHLIEPNSKNIHLLDRHVTLS